MSCEQSKARRHVEHVHTVNGDAIEIHAEENIKEKISEMKTRCFPNLGQMGLSDVYGSGTETESMAPPAATTIRGPRVKSQLETYKVSKSLTLFRFINAQTYCNLTDLLYFRRILIWLLLPTMMKPAIKLSFNVGFVRNKFRSNPPIITFGHIWENPTNVLTVLVNFGRTKKLNNTFKVFIHFLHQNSYFR